MQYRDVLPPGDPAAKLFSQNRGDIVASGRAHRPDYRILPAGDTALVVEFGDCIDRHISAKVLSLARRLNEAQVDGIVETVPTFRSLMVHYDPVTLSTSDLEARVVELMHGLQIREDVGRVWRLPACYDPSIAPDLDAVAARTGLSPAQVVECHSATTYHVYMLGFLPGMAYLGDVPAELNLPRLAAPRLKVPPGSLGIATTMTCVIPLETPSGWHVVGRSPVRFLEQRFQPRALLAAGDKVTFVPVSLREYEQLAAQAVAGTLKIVPVDEPAEAAA